MATTLALLGIRTEIFADVGALSLSHTHCLSLSSPRHLSLSLSINLSMCLPLASQLAIHLCLSLHLPVHGSFYLLLLSNICRCIHVSVYLFNRLVYAVMHNMGIHVYGLGFQVGSTLGSGTGGQTSAFSLATRRPAPDPLGELRTPA